MTFEVEKYDFQHKWFWNSGIHTKLHEFADPTKEHHILEIGNYEGMSACWFSDVWLSHPSSTLTCVDPFDLSDTCTPLTNETETRFHSNISKSTGYAKTSICKAYSDDFFQQNKNKFDIIYIDGSHLPDQITKDMENAFAVLHSGGIMWMDDYGGGDGWTIRNTMNAFLQKYQGQYVIIYVQYQLAIQKL